MKKIVLFVFLVLFYFPPITYAQSDYVLPYPPSMPGNKLYSLRLMGESIQGVWSFGNFAQFSYNLKLSDKYLVEAKTLFEYKQYLLGHTALQKSDRYIKKAAYYLSNAEREGKNIEEKKKVLQSAIEKHISVLEQLQTVTPEEFLWQPEKSDATKLNIRDEIGESIGIRRACL